MEKKAFLELLWFLSFIGFWVKEKVRRDSKPGVEPTHCNARHLMWELNSTTNLDSGPNSCKRQSRKLVKGKLHLPSLRFIKMTVRPPLVLKPTLTPLNFNQINKTPLFYINTLDSPSNCLFLERATKKSTSSSFAHMLWFEAFISHNERST